MKHLKSFAELKALSSDGKKYYGMKFNGQWYAIALEDFQFSHLMQHIPSSTFKFVCDSNKLKEATQPIQKLDLTSVDDETLMGCFIDRLEVQYTERNYSTVPNHISDTRCHDARTLNSNKEYAKMNPYYR